MLGTKRNTDFTWSKAAVEALDLTGKKAAVIGGTDGLGRAIAKLAAQQGAEVVVVGRTNRDEGAQRISYAHADLGLMRDAKRLGEGTALPPDVDVLLVTTGIMAAPSRQVTPEGIERDMAVSFLSRLAVLDAWLPRLTAAQSKEPLRIFIMGFPGAGQAGTLGDLNAEQAYSAMAVHMQTVAGNEALVHYLNKEWGAGSGGARPVEAFGLNPGLIQTGIRSNFYGSWGIFGRIMEWIIGFMSVTPEAYAKRMVPLLFAPELAGKPGLMFNQAADAILPTPALQDVAHVNAFIAESQALIAKGLAAELAPKTWLTFTQL